MKVKTYSKYLIIMSGIGGLLYGVDLGVISSALPYIEKTCSYTTEQLGMIVGMVLWGSCISSLVTGQLTE